jgi:hypothetical protein
MLMAAITVDINAQDCRKFHLYGSCMQYPGPGYKIDGQSRSNMIGVGDKLIYNVIFYGDRSYTLFFCASDKFSPVHFRITDSNSRALIFDNADEEYTEMLELEIEYTTKLMIEVSVLGHEADQEFKDNFMGCLGFLMYYKKEKN